MFRRSSKMWSLVVVASALGLPLVAGCPDPETAAGGKAKGPRTEKATQWMKRAAEELGALDLAEAKDSIDKANAASPGDAEISVLAARIALARLDFKSAAKALEGIDTSEAASLRARAFWYSDDLPRASEELSKALEDPSFKDPWAKPVRELAGTQGTGRKPFNLKDSSARVVEMRMPRDLGTMLMVPVEVDGQSTIAILDTGVPEVILDQKGRSSPGWVSIKFANFDGTRSMEFRDVPAFVQDLSPFTKGQTVPVGAVIGMNFLRRLHLTFDRLADQLVLRRDEPPAPAQMTKVAAGYYNGGGMLVRSTIRKEFEVSSGLWINTGTDVPLAFPEPIWKKIGVDTKTLPTHEGRSLARLLNIRLGGLDLGPADAVGGVPQLEEALAKFKGIDVMGQAGMGFLTGMRVTIADGGRWLWVETDSNTPLILAPPSGKEPKPPKPAAPKPTAAPPASAAPPSPAGFKPAPPASATAKPP
ncbi:MAG: hypothetical protein HYV09_23885, partial [Deltaproteobacteria bacterium]|nr:hypothetical protein [Deltaproteobacteria bacterium]